MDPATRLLNSKTSPLLFSHQSVSGNCSFCLRGYDHVSKKTRIYHSKLCRVVVVQRADSYRRGRQFEFCMCHHKILRVRKARGSHIIKSISLEKTQRSVSGFCYARNRVCGTVYFNRHDFVNLRCF